MVTSIHAAETDKSTTNITNTTEWIRDVGEEMLYCAQACKCQSLASWNQNLMPFNVDVVFSFGNESQVWIVLLEVGTSMSLLQL